MNRVILSLAAGAAALAAGAGAAAATAQADGLVTRFQQEILDEERLSAARAAGSVDRAAEEGEAESAASRIGRSLLRGAASRRESAVTTRFQEEPAEEIEVQSLGLGAGFREQSVAEIGERLLAQEFNQRALLREEDPVVLSEFEVEGTELAEALSTPLPAAFLLMGAGLIGLGGLARRRKRSPD